MGKEKVFKTKTGYCHILSDRIVITRDGVVGNVSQALVGNTIYRILIIYGLLSLFLLYSAYTSFSDGQFFFSFIFGALGAFLLFGISKSFNNSATPIIYRNSIKNILFIRGNKGLTRSRFEVLFTNEKQQVKKRIIMMPGSLTNGEIEIEKALHLMKEEKLYPWISN